MIIFARRGNKRLKKIRANRRDVVIQADRSVVKIIMSKFEILQSNKIIKELKKIYDFFMKMIFWDRKQSK
ncbi:MAG: hypothetical protein WCL02_04420 [bacterium]